MKTSRRFAKAQRLTMKRHVSPDSPQGAISRMGFFYNLKTTNQNKKMMPPAITITFIVGSILVGGFPL